MAKIEAVRRKVKERFPKLKTDVPIKAKTIFPKLKTDVPPLYKPRIAPPKRYA